MERKEISEQIGALNLKIYAESKELEEMELAVKKKKIEIKRYKNELRGLQLRIQEIEIEKWKEKKTQKEKVKKQIQSEINYKEDANSDYYSQENKFHNIGNTYIDYMEKNILPYND